VSAVPDAWLRWADGQRPLRLGVSACLLGHAVRHDGGHARSRFAAEALARFAQLVAVCPELDAGLGAPRPALRVVAAADGLELRESASGRDHTAAFAAAAERRLAQLGLDDLDGFVVRKGSPSCALERLRVYRGRSVARRDGVGLFTRRLLELAPLLPVEEDGRLQDPALRERFLLRVFCRSRWRVLRARGITRRGLVAFHAAHKLLLSTHDDASCRRLGRLVAACGTLPDAELFRRYGEAFQAALARPASRGRHANALQHALGHLKRGLGAVEKREALLIVEDYRRGLLPLSAPVALVRTLARRCGTAYLVEQLYLDPYPKELGLRNAA
jgi:uncharacterized protein YbgA (DUF1722 family)/uncharacterized protein YbbK (DUF523 family)